jgi:integrase
VASIYLRGEVIWMKFKNKHGKPECRSSGYRRGQEALARELAEEVERQAKLEREAMPAAAPERAPAEPKAARVLPMPADATASAPAASGTSTAPSEPIDRIGSDAPPGALTVRAYTEEWLGRRVEIATVKDEAARLRLHVYPLIGHMALAEVRPKHIRDLINAVKQKTSDAPKCKGERLAPRTVRLVYATLRLMFKSAVIDEHISASPVIVEKGVLPKNVDKDPEWRSTAIFDREELIAIVSDRRIAMYRRVFYALEGISGVRHSEAAGLRWRDHNPKCEPLGKLTVSRSGEKLRTKTQVTREIPVHPSLAMILDDWRAIGWAEKYGRAPTPDDLILPTDDNKVRKPSNTLKEFHKDLTRIGFRTRRGHDLRRTFISLAQADGARRDVLRPLTHPGEQDIIGLYTTFPWPVVCAEIMKLQIQLPGAPRSAAPVEIAPAAGASPEILAAPVPARVALAEVAPAPNETGAQIVDQRGAAVAGYSASYNPECSPEKLNSQASLGAVAQVGLRFTKPLLYP